MRYERALKDIKVLGAGISPEAFLNYANELHLQFPDDYRDFFLEADGAEGLWGGENYASIWPIELLKTYNESYEVSTYLSDMILFGSDGGGEAFAFDVHENMAIFRIPFIGMGRDLAIKTSESFAEFIDALCSKDIYGT